MYHPDNGSDVRKILESQRKSFRELLEKEFDKLSLHYVHLPKFIIGDKPENKDSRLLPLNRRVQKLIGCEISKS